MECCGAQEPVPQSLLCANALRATRADKRDAAIVIDLDAAGPQELLC
jgi:hypothetical protein